MTTYSYILFDRDCSTIVGAYTTPDKAETAREKRESELGFKPEMHLDGSLYIAWIPVDEKPNPNCDEG